MNATEKRLTRTDARETLLESVRVWLVKHHGPLDAVYLLRFLHGDCEHPYHVTSGNSSEREYVCDLCGG